VCETRSEGRGARTEKQPVGVQRRCAPTNSRHSLFAIRYSRILTDPCSPTEMGVQQRMRGCPRTEARVWNRLRQPRHVAAGRVENPPYTDPTIRHSPFLPIRHSPLATRHSPVAVVPRSPLAGRRLPPFAIRYSLFAVFRCSLLAVFPHSCAAAVCGTGWAVHGAADQSRLRIKWM
jgi:hypothetical protein